MDTSERGVDKRRALWDLSLPGNASRARGRKRCGDRMEESWRKATEKHRPLLVLVGLDRLEERKSGGRVEWNSCHSSLAGQSH